ncbi:LOW QUALITY PROTEIN: 39S ribosomal protein L19, mitochondrial [Gracilinanus agilis]|uniref:LOW QUALITY PROTEIN: 39S ribosomal protein L19, mitochondrial n=1 Tax=Gracilinanus agilis TaxID=191870 RepID=UPI001CFCCCD6|nr:LOW QUALITY PROTEIN: 39S ribosomal protein L19, mitochondrial [Gracilinanus agilis]
MDVEAAGAGTCLCPTPNSPPAATGTTQQRGSSGERPGCEALQRLALGAWCLGHGPGGISVERTQGRGQGGEGGRRAKPGTLAASERAREPVSSRCQEVQEGPVPGTPQRLGRVWRRPPGEQLRGLGEADRAPGHQPREKQAEWAAGEKPGQSQPSFSEAGPSPLPSSATVPWTQVSLRKLETQPRPSPGLSDCPLAALRQVGSDRGSAASQTAAFGPRRLPSSRHRPVMCYTPRAGADPGNMAASAGLASASLHLRLRLGVAPRLSACRALSGPGTPGGFQPPPKPVIVDKRREPERERRFLSPEFLPPRGRTKPLKFQLERQDMLERRKVLHIPEFYVGSILAVTSSDPHAKGKSSRFLGICTQRSGHGLGATFVLRNTIEGQGVEICFDLYSPRIQEIQVVRLEKRLDDNLMYLRDALPEYSTFELDMKPEAPAAGQEVPVNPLKVKMKPRPWSKRWERPKFNIQGIRFDLCLSEEQLREARKWSQPWLEFDMMRERPTEALEAQIWEEVEAARLGRC